MARWQAIDDSHAGYHCDHRDWHCNPLLNLGIEYLVVTKNTWPKLLIQCIKTCLDTELCINTVDESGPRSFTDNVYLLCNSKLMVCFLTLKRWATQLPGMLLACFYLSKLGKCHMTPPYKWICLLCHPTPSPSPYQPLCFLLLKMISHEYLACFCTWTS